jgi:hypothetical protein
MLQFLQAKAAGAAVKISAVFFLPSLWLFLVRSQRREGNPSSTFSLQLTA